jgi:hypothetical protein
MPKMDLDVIGTEGQINLSNFVLPQMMHSIKIKTNSDTETKSIYGNNDTSYGNQLKAFVNEIRKSEKQPYNEELKVYFGNMNTISSILMFFVELKQR